MISKISENQFKINKKTIAVITTGGTIAQKIVFSRFLWRKFFRTNKSINFSQFFKLRKEVKDI